MLFLVMHITNQKLRLDIFTVQISSWNMILISNDFWHKIKMIFLSHTTVGRVGSKVVLEVRQRGTNYSLM